MRKLAYLSILVLLGAARLAGQCPPAPGAFANNTSSLGSELNIGAPVNGTANSVTTPTTQDNLASASPGNPISLTVSNTAGAQGGLPITLLFSPGGPSGPLNLAPGSPIYLNVLAFAALVDGIGLTGAPQPFVAHPGPGLLFALFTSLPAVPLGSCFTFQSVLIDPTSPLGFRISNAVALEVAPGITNVSGTNFGPYGAAVTATTTGSGSGTFSLPASDPSNIGLGALGFPATGVGATAGIIPIGAGSGSIDYSDATAPGITSSAAVDSLDAFFAVTSNAIVTNPGPSALTLLPTANAPAIGFTESMASVTGTLANSAATDVYTFAVTEGDVVEVELYSLNPSQTRILDGRGNGLNPAATAGFDPIVTLRHSTNVLPLTFNLGAAGPFNVARDDDSGPGFNARTTFQVRGNDTASLVVGTSDPASFVTGDYLLTVRVLTGAPVVRRFTIGGSPANAAADNEAVTIFGASIQAGLLYDITLTPAHGLYAPIVISTVPSLVPGELTFVTPPFAPGSFGVGVHYVQLRDLVSGSSSAIWSTAPINQLNGILPEVLVMRSLVLDPITPVGGGTLTATPNARTIVASSATAAFVGGYFFFAATAPQTIYVEVLGTDQSSNNRLVDSNTPELALTGSIYNSMFILFGQGGAPQLAENDEDGILPTPFAWPVMPALGIGRNAAVIAPAGAGAVLHWGFVDERVCLGACSFPRGAIINVVVL